VAAAIKEATGVDVAVVEGGRGEFSVRVGDRVVAEKSPRGFPADSEIVSLVQGAIQP
jgi:hypothetical protein